MLGNLHKGLVMGPNLFRVYQSLTADAGNDFHCSKGIMLSGSKSNSCYVTKILLRNGRAHTIQKLAIA